MASLVRRETSGEVFPPRAGAQYPEDAVHYFAVLSPRPAPSVFSDGKFWQMWFNDRPLFVR